MPAILSFVSELPNAVVSHVRELTSRYQLVCDREGSSGIWVNHCEHCGARMSEEELHDGLDGPFGPEPHEGLESVRLHEVREPFEASAGAECYYLIPLDG